MLTKIKKYFILFTIDILISAFIWHINASWGNTFWTCLILSTTTFLIIFTPFQIYFSWRDIYFDRWENLYLKELEISKVKVKVEGGYLYADLIKSKNQEARNSKNTVVIISPGFSDKKESLQYYYFPLAYHGYIILAYDARGIGESKKAGNRSDFLKRIDDFIRIIEWLKTSDKFSQMKIYSVGLSIGALTVLCGGFPNKDVDKIIAISSMSDYKKNILESNLIVKLSYLMKGISFSPDDIENRKLSPSILIKDIRNSLSEVEWKLFSERVLLIHTRNDKIIPFKNFEENCIILESSDKNQVILSKGGHTQKKNELVLVGATLRFFNE